MIRTESLRNPAAVKKVRREFNQDSPESAYLFSRDGNRKGKFKILIVSFLGCGSHSRGEHLAVSWAWLKGPFSTLAF